ncbi:hypothetical protein V1511DRAFT_512900 [Dipodascopsis uninucleata]
MGAEADNTNMRYPEGEQFHVLCQPQRASLLHNSEFKSSKEYICKNWFDPGSISINSSRIKYIAIFASSHDYRSIDNPTKKYVRHSSKPRIFASANFTSCLICPWKFRDHANLHKDIEDIGRNRYIRYTEVINKYEDHSHASIASSVRKYLEGSSTYVHDGRLTRQLSIDEMFSKITHKKLLHHEPNQADGTYICIPYQG